MAVGFETTCGIGLALPIEPPKALNLNRERSSTDLPGAEMMKLEEF
jgi:hypothetical protein